MNRVLELGCRGDDVARWQHFLLGFATKNGVDAGPVDGDFGSATFDHTRRFQRLEREAGAQLSIDGRVGPDTLAHALSAGFFLLEEPEGVYPQKPAFGAMTDNACDQNYGRFEYQLAPDGNTLIIDPHWVSTNIVTIEVPWCNDSTTSFRVHRLARSRFEGLFADWQKAGLLGRLSTNDGGFVPRRKRGATTISRHASGLAIDINAFANLQGYVPAQQGVFGSLRELVPYANARGVYWGGFFHHVDGMHWEVALPPEH